MELKNKLGLETYKILFQVILTDNGIEFSLLDEIENDENGELITKVFFCDPYKSSQKDLVKEIMNLLDMFYLKVLVLII